MNFLSLSENFSFPDERRLNIKLIGFICFHLVSMMFRRFRERYPLSLRFERFKKKISSNVEYLLVIIVLSFREHSTLELMNKVFSRLRNLFIYERMVEHHPPDSSEFSITKKEKEINLFNGYFKISFFF